MSIRTLHTTTTLNRIGNTTFRHGIKKNILNEQTIISISKSGTKSIKFLPKDYQVPKYYLKRPIGDVEEIFINGRTLDNIDIKPMKVLPCKELAMKKANFRERNWRVILKEYQEKVDAVTAPQNIRNNVNIYSNVEKK